MPHAIELNFFFFYHRKPRLNCYSGNKADFHVTYFLNEEYFEFIIVIYFPKFSKQLVKQYIGGLEMFLHFCRQFIQYPPH